MTGQMDASPPAIAPRHIALFDILGFKNIIETEEPRHGLEVLADVIDLTKRALKLGVRWEGIISIRVFQDTVVAYTNTDSPEELKCLVGYACNLVAMAFPGGVFLRGAVTTGIVLTTDEAVIGEAFVRAYEMEQAQDWVGGWLDEKCATPEVIESVGSLLVRYAIPLKSGPVRMAWVLNWPLIVASVDLQLLRRGWAALASQADRAWATRRKAQEVNWFLEYLVAGNWEPTPFKHCGHGHEIQHVKATWWANHALYSTLPEYAKKFRSPTPPDSPHGSDSPGQEKPGDPDDLS